MTGNSFRFVLGADGTLAGGEVMRRLGQRCVVLQRYFPTAAAARGENVPGRGGAEGRTVQRSFLLPFEKRVADLVSRMTLQEKAEQVQYLTSRNAELDIPPVCLLVD